MRRLLATLSIFGVISILGVASAYAVTGASKHTGSAVISCQDVKYTFVDFANANNNVISYVVKIDNATVASGTLSFNGTSGAKTVPITVSGSHTVRATATWNTNGHAGSFDSGNVQVVCSTTTTTTASTTTTTVPSTTVVTTTAPTVTVPGQTVTVTVPVSVPGPTTTVTVPGPTVTVTVPKTVVKTVVKTRTVVKKVPVKCVKRIKQPYPYTR